MAPGTPEDSMPAHGMGPLFFRHVILYPHYGIVSAKRANCARPTSTEFSHSQRGMCGMEGIWPVKARALGDPIVGGPPSDYLWICTQSIAQRKEQPSCSIGKILWATGEQALWVLEYLNSPLIILTNSADNRIVHAFWLAKSIGDAGSTFVCSESRFSCAGTCHNLFVHIRVQLS